MTGSDADTEHDPAAEAPGNDADGVPPKTLAKFLTPPPAPRTSAPPAAVLPERTSSLFSELPVPRRDPSSRPPAADAHLFVEPPPKARSRPPIAFDPMTLLDETPHASLTIESEGMAFESKDEEDLELASIPPPLFRASRFRVVALASGVAVGLLGVALLANRSGKGQDARPSPVATAGPATERAAAPAVAAPPGAIGEEDIPRPFDANTARELRLEARKLLEAGHAQEGVDIARRAIGADPNEPENYVLLAAGLQDLGRWQESRDVFMKCVRQSDRKANAECVYFATRSK